MPDSSAMPMTKLEKKEALLTLFLAVDDLLRNDAYAPQLKWVWEDDDGGMLAAFLIENLPAPLSDEDQQRTVTAFCAFLQHVSAAYLALSAEGFETPLSTELFMKISRSFLDFEEHWEDVIRKQHFVEFAQAFDTGQRSTLPLQQQLLITYVLAKTAEDKLDFAGDEVTLLAIAMASLDRYCS